MKDSDFTLELSDGTVLQVGSLRNARHPDIKAYFLPTGSLTPFSRTNLPTAPRGEDRSDPSFSSSL